MKSWLTILKSYSTCSWVLRCSARSWMKSRILGRCLSRFCSKFWSKSLRIWHTRLSPLNRRNRHSLTQQRAQQSHRWTSISSSSRRIWFQNSTRPWSRRFAKTQVDHCLIWSSRWEWPFSKTKSITRRTHSFSNSCCSWKISKTGGKLKSILWIWKKKFQEADCCRSRKMFPNFIQTLERSSWRGSSPT